MKKLFDIYKRYRVLNKRILDIAKNGTSLKSTLFALLVTVLALLIPFLALIEAFVIPEIRILISVLILLTMCGGLFLYYFMYYKLMRSYNEELENVNVKLPFFFESILTSVIVFILGIIIILVIFI